MHGDGRPVRRRRAGHGHRRPDAALQACSWVRDQPDYVQGSASVSTSGIEAWQAGAGVCQDFAHLTLGVLRATGIPGRGVFKGGPAEGLGVEVELTRLG
ncbi:MAG: transglutaminase family protein [Acidimicrobiales bacterium]